jgi:hypothetical protein
MGEPPPPEYVELVLCRDVFHCTPSELRRESARDIMIALEILKAEADYQRHEQQKVMRNGRI